MILNISYVTRPTEDTGSKFSQVMRYLRDIKSKQTGWWIIFNYIILRQSAWRLTANILTDRQLTTDNWQFLFEGPFRIPKIAWFSWWAGSNDKNSKVKKKISSNFRIHLVKFQSQDSSCIINFRNNLTAVNNYPNNAKKLGFCEN